MAGNAWAQGVVDEYISGNTLHLTVDFNGAITADIDVAFENVDGLAAGALGASVDMVDVSDPDLLARLPAGGLVSIPAAFPIKLSIAPPADGDLLFRGVAVVSLHTHNLAYAPGTPLRLFKAAHGGPFADVTDRMSSGSYRVRGSQGEFSEFMIVADLRPAASVVTDKFTRLENLLQQQQSAIDSDLYATLSAAVTSAKADYLANSLASSIRALSDFDQQVIKARGGEIPDVWRPAGDLTNSAGELRAAAATLRFSLSLLTNGL
jgi:hypothetical protein